MLYIQGNSKGDSEIHIKLYRNPKERATPYFCFTVNERIIWGGSKLSKKKAPRFSGRILKPLETWERENRRRFRLESSLKFRGGGRLYAD